ncbi:hypothetical protein GE191_23405 [Serratia fonticola]|uniref:hypothetical protein n=1 Tax=Serratia fonticola TaxID=47917 RepID=UPI001378EC8C|nr:hypothetical protein [Serratia fonticola]NBJ36604.1 hypothetical protein [Serratia fonticola]
MIKIIDSPWTVLVLVLVSIVFCSYLGGLAFIFLLLALVGTAVWMVATVIDLANFFLAGALSIVGAMAVSTTTASAYVQLGWICLPLILLALTISLLAFYQARKRGLFEWIQ